MTQQDLSRMLGNLLGDKAARLGPLIQSALNMFLQDRGGNLQGLIDQLTAGGLGQQAQSWVRKGRNESVSGAQVTRALGADQIQDLATRAGCTPQEAADGLAEALPKVIDQLTPKGHVPDPVAMQRHLQQLLNR